MKSYTCSLTNNEKLEVVKRLRKETGWSMMVCKEALHKSSWK